MQKRNTVVTAVVLLAVLVLGFFITRSLYEKPGGKAVIEVNGERCAELELSEDTEFKVEGEDGAYNIVKVENGYVYVSGANCGDLVCVRTGKINESGRVIACLPHGLIVYVEEKG